MLEPGLLNTALEDALAHCAKESERRLVLEAWLRLGVEYFAREAGRREASEALRALDTFVREAKPAPDWPA